MKNFFLYLFIFFLFISWPTLSDAAALSERLVGRILLQVEGKGEAWYVNPVDYRRYYLGRPDDAFRAMRQMSRGISNVDLEKIALPGALFSADTAFARKNAGWIFLQVEGKGEAWYVNPVDYRRYYLGRPDDAFRVMRELGLGVNNTNLNKIAQGTLSGDYREMAIERRIFDLVNEERKKNNLSVLRWNNDLFRVAREHSSNQAAENDVFTGLGMSCDFPMIHHEGLVFGADNSERLNNRGVYYFGKTAENIALLTEARVTVSYEDGSTAQRKMDNCQNLRTNLSTEMKSTLDFSSDMKYKMDVIKSEIEKRKKMFATEEQMEIQNLSWSDEESIAREMVEGWMNSPGHRANILTADYDESGLGIARVDGYIIGTQVFIKRAVCGYLNGSCCREENYFPYCYIPLNCDEENICRE